jgi:hypothetical protein
LKLKVTDPMAPAAFRNAGRLDALAFYVATIASGHMLAFLHAAFSHEAEVESYLDTTEGMLTPLRRRMLNLRPRKGRWSVLTKGQESTLWEQWYSRVKAGGVMLQEQTAMLNVAMDLAAAHCLPLSVVWNAISEWIKQNGSNKA